MFSLCQKQTVTTIGGMCMELQTPVVITMRGLTFQPCAFSVVIKGLYLSKFTSC